MRLGPTLVGGAIGAIVGVTLHLIVELVTGFEAPWFAVLIGLLTGLGVHQANKSLAGRVSYLRGAVTAAIALAAIVGSTPLISFVARSRGVAEGGGMVVAEGADERAPVGQNGDHQAGAADASASGAAAPTGAQTEGPLRTATVAGGPQLQYGDRFNLLQFAFMAIGTFIAYEFGRGTAPRAAAAESASSEPAMASEPGH
jgi:hypothetical protein